MTIPKTRKTILKKINQLGGTNRSPLARKLAHKFNNLVIKERVRKHGLGSLNPYDSANARFLKTLKRRK